MRLWALFYFSTLHPLMVRVASNAFKTAKKMRTTHTLHIERISLLIIGIFCCSAANAQFDPSKLWVDAGVYSVHFDSKKGLRNPNPGLGIEYSIDDTWRVTAGRFINSDNAHSSYLGAYYQAWDIGPVKLGLVGGAFNGYPKAFNGGWFPAVLPVASWEGRQFGLNVALVPPLKDRLYGAVSFKLKYRFQE